MTNKEFKAFAREACAPILNYRNGDTRAKQKALAAEEAVQLIEKALDEYKEPARKAAKK